MWFQWVDFFIMFFHRACYPDEGEKEKVRNKDCPVCQKNLSVVAASLPYAHCSQSRLVCFITGEPLNESTNRPMMLPNGYVYGEKVKWSVFSTAALVSLLYRCCDRLIDWLIDSVHERGWNLTMWNKSQKLWKTQFQIWKAWSSSLIVPLLTGLGADGQWCRRDGDLPSHQGLLQTQRGSTGFRTINEMYTKKHTCLFKNQIKLFFLWSLFGIPPVSADKLSLSRSTCNQTGEIWPVSNARDNWLLIVLPPIFFSLLNFNFFPSFSSNKNIRNWLSAWNAGKNSTGNWLIYKAEKDCVLCRFSIRLCRKYSHSIADFVIEKGDGKQTRKTAAAHSPLCSL